MRNADKSHDVLVVGTGMAGWTAARRAQQLGLDVVAIDKGEGPGASNARMSMGFMNAAYMDIRENSDVLKTYADEVTSGLARAELVEVWAENCARTIDWLAGENIVAGLLPELRNRLYLLPFRLTPQGLAEYDRERGPDKALTSHMTHFVGQGGVYLSDSRAIELLVDSLGRVGGAKVQTPDGTRDIRAHNVVLSDGGFQANPELLRKYVGPSADKMKLRSMSSQTGDGLSMALRLGAAVDNMSYFYGHMMHLDSLTNDQLWPYPVLDALIADGILVNRQGQRFVDERVAGEGMSRLAMSGVGRGKRRWPERGPARHLRHTGCGVVATAGSGQGAWRVSGHTSPVNDAIVQGGGTVHRADSLAELARQAGIDPHGLVATVDEFNAAVVAGKTAELAVPRSAKPEPLVAAPFYAMPSVAGITFTLGGVRINRNGQVQHEDGRTIPGLYAAGGTAGGLGGGPRGGYLGGLACATVFGLVSAEHIAASKQPGMDG